MKRKFNTCYKIHLNPFEKLIYNRFNKLVETYNNIDKCYKTELLKTIMSYIHEERDILLGIPEYKEDVENFKLKISHYKYNQDRDVILPKSLHY
jgi:hypothetical protein